MLYFITIQDIRYNCIKISLSHIVIRVLKIPIKSKLIILHSN